MVIAYINGLCFLDLTHHNYYSRCDEADIHMVPTGQGKLEKVREFSWSGKVRENAELLKKSGKMAMLFHVH